MFSDKYGLTDAVLKGRKTMTRRIARFNETERPCQKGRDKCLYCIHYDREEGCKWLLNYSPYKVGEVLAVAQAYKSIPTFDDPRFIYITPKHKGWTNKMFVRADLMPHKIRITDIKMERLQNISEEDCLKEGLIKMFWGYCYEYHDRHGRSFKGSDRIRDAFADLIDGVSGKDTWASNPFVFAYSFELVK